MEWITSNWVLLLIAVLFIGMHLFGYGCCGHRKNDKHSGDGSDHHKGHANAGSSDGSTPKKEHDSCH